MSRLARMGQELYDGQRSIDFVGRKWLWYSFSGVIVAIAVYGLLVPRLNLGIEFEGGVEYRVAMAPGEATQDNVTKVSEAVVSSGLENAQSPVVNTSGENNIRVQVEPLTADEADRLEGLIEDAVPVEDISSQLIGPSWGQQVADRALLGLGVFLVLVVLLIWAYFREWKMSVAALVALAHDVVITVGVYALSGFEVTPATVTGVLTILGFSLYDTVVVFDKVRENTRELPRTHQTYAEAANLAVNQTLVRSISTSIVALLPVAAILYAGVVTIGSGALKDLALALFVGMAAGIFSSIFIATPLLVQLKELEPGVKAGDARARQHRSRRAVDPYAAVPVYTEDMPIHTEPGAAGRRRAGGLAINDDPSDPESGEGGVGRGGSRPVPPGPPGRVSAGEREGSARPVSDTTAAGRPQPRREPRSRRGKR